MIRKCMLVGVICILVLTTLPVVNADNEYPQDGGPYLVFIGGKCSRGGNKPIWFDFSNFFQGESPRWCRIGPFSLHRWPVGPHYLMENQSIFMVNGKMQNIEYPVSIVLKGFKGFSPASYHVFVKTSGRIRIFGICEEISLLYECG